MLKGNARPMSAYAPKPKSSGVYLQSSIDFEKEKSEVEAKHVKPKIQVGPRKIMFADARTPEGRLSRQNSTRKIRPVTAHPLNDH